MCNINFLIKNSPHPAVFREFICFGSLARPLVKAFVCCIARCAETVLLNTYCDLLLFLSIL